MEDLLKVHNSALEALRKVEISDFLNLIQQPSDKDANANLMGLVKQFLNVIYGHKIGAEFNLD